MNQKEKVASERALRRLQRTVNTVRRERDDSRTTVCEDFLNSAMAKLCKHCACSVSLGLPCLRFFLDYSAILSVDAAEVVTLQLIKILEKSKVNFLQLSPLLILIYFPNPQKNKEQKINSTRPEM